MTRDSCKAAARFQIRMPLRIAALAMMVLHAGLGVSRAETIELPQLIAIPAGEYVAGSDEDEREAAYRLDEKAYGHSNTRQWGWYDREQPRHTASLPAYCILRTPVTNRQYRQFVEATGHAAPEVTPGEWRGYKLIHPFERTRRHAWSKGVPPKDRGDHPVVMVSYADAGAFASWASEKTGLVLRLPTGEEWEKAIRGTDGRWFPWGNDFDADRLNSHDKGPFDTVPVGRFETGQSPFGLLDGAGQVFEWTSEPAGKGRHYVRGGSWDDSGCGVCRAAARHGRPDGIKHILIGFRLVAETCGK